MKAILRLQVLRFARASRHAGLAPAVAAALLLLGGVLLAALVYARLGWLTAPVLTAAAIFATGALASLGRTDWRSPLLGLRAARRWRFFLATVVTAVAAVLLLLLGAPLYLLFLLPAYALALWRPTIFGLPGGLNPWTLSAGFAPFGKTPYAFVAGLRRRGYGYVPLSFVLAKALQTPNANLAVVGVLVWVLLPASFYGETEPEYLLRQDVRAARAFLADKLAVGLRQHAVLCAAPLLVVGAALPTHLLWLLLVYGYGALVLAGAIGLAYRSYPSRPSLPEQLFFAAAAVVAPALPAYVWWSLRTARAHLSRYLP